MSTVRMRTPSGKIAEVPADKVAEAQADGLVEVFRMATPSGKITEISADMVAEAEADGLKKISPQEFETNFKPALEQRNRVASAPTSIAGALFSAASERSTQPLKDFRERNVVTGKEIRQRFDQISKEDPSLSLNDAWQKAGGSKLTSTIPPLALTGPAGATAAAAYSQKVPVVMGKVGEIIGRGARGLYETAKTVGQGGLLAAGAAGADALSQKIFGKSLLPWVANDITGTTKE